ncbi:MAG: class I SAM-dependent methyltransferase [Nitrospirae bacterium]|nr:class I SAM-dependent methyltransferase [Nitrospirota bacterium]
MDIFREKQIAAEEQKVVIQTLADSVTGEGCRILEIGSWCGESSVILGTIAKKKNGRLFCIDWWRGNVGLELEQIAANHDIFSIFWNKMKSEELDNTVIPIRTRSDMAYDIFKAECFDLIYIDADHRYEAVLNDIRFYAPLVKQGGIICGDDCEGYRSDYDMDFLDKGKMFDSTESVHCGVVLAVAESFQSYSINYNVWSAKKTPEGWVPANVFPSDSDNRQYQPPPISAYNNYNLIRLGKLIYAVPQSLGNYNITEESNRHNPLIIAGKTINEITESIDKQGQGYKGFNIVIHESGYYAVPQSLGNYDITTESNRQNPLIIIGKTINEITESIDKQGQGYKGFNIVAYKDIYYGVPQPLGNLDITMESNRQNPQVITGNTINEITGFIDKTGLRYDVLIKESYKNFNIIEFQGKFYAVSQSLGSVDFTTDGLMKFKDHDDFFVSDSIEDAIKFVDKYSILKSVAKKLFRRITSK